MKGSTTGLGGRIKRLEEAGDPDGGMLVIFMRENETEAEAKARTVAERRMAKLPRVVVCLSVEDARAV